MPREIVEPDKIQREISVGAELYHHMYMDIP